MPEAIFLLILVTETLKYTCVPSFTFMHCMVSKLGGEEVVIFESVLRPFYVDGRHGNTQIHMCTKFQLRALHGLQV